MADGDGFGSRPEGWLPPFIAFGSVLIGLVWFLAWAWGHRRDED